MKELEMSNSITNNNKTVITVILDRLRKEALEDHFTGMGLNFSNGVRMVLYDYMEKNGINTKNS
jgi:antitoxin component of RelBE/YafQ-DinJ toxin-antitoxin module